MLHKIYIRFEAAERLIRAAELLPPDYSLMVFDAHRPIEVQREIFEAQKRKFGEQYPELDPDQISKMTEIYVSLPSSDLTRPSPHATGGAIDLTVFVGNRAMNMGTEWDSFEESSRTEFFKGKDSEIHNNRNLLYSIMTEAGFTNYPEEWWHYDFGNQFWGHILKQNAIYGLIKGGDLSATKS